MWYPPPIGNAQPEQAPNHILIEADNYHALQLLLFAYEGKLDCIYIDPPYNTGARDWKYNNDYVDGNDRWRHSKWLSMMQRRLKLAARLLKPDGVLCVTIDDYEAHRLQCLLQDYFSELSVLGVALIRNNPSGRATVSGFSVTHEFALFVGRQGIASIKRLPRSIEQWNRYREADELGPYQWLNFRKDGGSVTYRKARPKQFYPVYIDAEQIRIPKMEWDKESRNWIVLEGPTPKEKTIWPLDSKRDERVWSYGHETARMKLGDMQVRYDEEGNPSVFRKNRPAEGVLPRTWWEKSEYSAREYGTTALKAALSDGLSFQFAKSPYAVRDCLLVAGCLKHDALILDFFAGSGTTLNAVNLLNAADGGQRQCILVTNNEVSEAEAAALEARCVQPGQPDWEAQGICRSVTWPRSKFTIQGHRDDGTPLPGDYLTGKTKTIEKTRAVRQLGVVEGRSLTVPQRKQLAAVMEGVTQSKVSDAPWLLDAGMGITVLWDVQQGEDWCEALAEGGEHIHTALIVTTDKRQFEALRERVLEVLGPITEEMEDKRPLSAGFAANLEYFKLDFLDPREVQLGRQFAGVLPVLWMMAGAKGTRPEPPAATAPWLIPADCPFAVLLHEGRSKPFFEHIAGRDDLTHVFFVTNSHDAFVSLKRELGRSGVRAVQLYRDYLENFKINTGEGEAA